jgi:hypothetical protein
MTIMRRAFKTQCMVLTIAVFLTACRPTQVTTTDTPTVQSGGQVNVPANKHTASPPKMTVELDQIEPDPIGISVQESIFFAAGGGGEPVSRTRIEWIRTLSEDSIVPWLVACGYPKSEKPIATLVKPDGSSEIINADSGSIYSYADDCVRYTIHWTYGMEFGQYTLNLGHSEKQLSQSWSIQYPNRPVQIPLTELDAADQQRFLVGFAPKQTLKMRFYAFTAEAIDSGIGTFIASRSATVDENGALFLNIKIGRSAPIAGQAIVIVIDGYRSSQELTWVMPRPWHFLKD